MGTAEQIQSGDEHFDASDMVALSDLVAATWTAAADRDWSVRAGGLDWTCLAAADHAVDCVYAPAFFLASRRVDTFPVAGSNLELGEHATPEHLVESLQIATRLLVSLVAATETDVRAVLFRRGPLLGAPHDFLPRAALELILHSHDVCTGLGVAFDPPRDLCRRLCEHTRPWTMWTSEWNGLPATGDPWVDLLRGSGR